MRSNSLSLRLFVAASASVLLALLTTGIVFSSYFKTYFEDRIRAELATHLQQLTANIEIDAAGQFMIYPLSDQRFDQPFSGLYWQIDPIGTKPLHSRSLWDLTLDLQRPETLGQQEVQRIESAGFNLIVLSWVVTVGGQQNPTELMLSVATGYDQVQATADKFNKNLALWLSLLAVALIFAAWLQVRVGLQPLEAVRGELQKIRNGTSQHMPDNVPNEVAPLVAEINELLETQHKNLTQARSHAGDLAHGLKTPLTIMRVLAQQIRDGSTENLADEIDVQTEAMAHVIERELARSRMGPTPSLQTELRPVVTRMVAAISKLPSKNKIDWQVKIPTGITAPFDEFNLSEMLGNLLDNAREWTKNTVTISASQSEGKTVFCIADNGPGVAEAQLDNILVRGERIDKTRTGSGLGLAIVQDLVRQHGCEMTLGNAPNGGLVVTVSWH